MRTKTKRGGERLTEKLRERIKRGWAVGEKPEKRKAIRASAVTIKAGRSCLTVVISASTVPPPQNVCWPRSDSQTQLQIITNGVFS